MDSKTVDVFKCPDLVSRGGVMGGSGEGGEGVSLDHSCIFGNRTYKFSFEKFIS